MLCVAFLECPFRKSDVVFARSVFVGGDLCVVDDAGCETVVVEWAFVFLLAVACFVGCRVGGGCGVVDDFLIMFANDGSHVVCAAVTNFDVIFVEELMEFMVFVEVLVDELEKGFADVGFYVFTVGRVVPDDVSLSVSSCSRW